jgi:hypothetical protein
MARPSTIDQLSEEIRTEIGRLRMQGRTIDQILAHLRTLDGDTLPPSRSALGRHIKGLEAVAERVRRSRAVAEALVGQMGDVPESQAARVNIELMHTVVMDLFTSVAEGDEDVPKDGKAALAGSPEGVMFLAKSLDHLARASKTNIDFIAAAERRATEKAKREAATAVEVVAREKGLSADTVNAIKAGIFGVRAAA